MARLANRKVVRKFLQKYPSLRYVEWSIEAGLLKLFWLVTSQLPVERASRLGNKLMSKIGPRLQKNRHVIQNIATIFPGKSAAEITMLAARAWGNFGSVLAEFPHLKKLLEDKNNYIEIVADDKSKSIIESNQPTIFVVPHMGNWELAAGVMVNLGIPLSAIFSPQQNPMLDRMIQIKRESLGCKFLTKHSALRAMFRELRNDRCIGLLPDQRVDSGKLVPFCEVEAQTTTSPARVAIKHNCAIIPLRMQRLDHCRFKAIFYAPLYPRDGPEDGAHKAFELTTRINVMFASWIKETPEQWLCMKRRWPKQR